MTQERAIQLRDTLYNWANGITAAGSAQLSVAEKLALVNQWRPEINTALSDGSISGMLKIRLQNGLVDATNKLSTGYLRPQEETAKSLPPNLANVSEPTYNPTITTSTPVSAATTAAKTLDYYAIAKDAFQSVMNKSPLSTELAVIVTYARAYAENNPTTNGEKLKSELISKISDAKAKGSLPGMSAFTLMSVMSDTGTLQQPILTGENALIGRTTTTLQPATTITPITDTSRVEEPTYNPVITTPSQQQLASTSSQLSTATTEESQTKIAGLGSNVWMIVVLVGAFLGLLFLKGKK